MWGIKNHWLNCICKESFYCKIPTSVYSVNYLPNVDVFDTAVLSDSIKEDKIIFGWIVSVLIIVLSRFSHTFVFPCTALGKSAFARQ